MEFNLLKEKDLFQFGYYNGQPVIWEILDISNQGVVCLSSYVLDWHIFDKENNDWKNSELRQWANSEFYNEAFSLEEKKFIISHEGDKVFILSKEEAQTFLHKIENFTIHGEKAWCWLRSPGYHKNLVSCLVFDVNDFDCYTEIDNPKGGFRPAIILDKIAYEYIKKHQQYIE